MQAKLDNPKMAIMNKSGLIKRIEAIHAIKCAKTIKDEEAENSFKQITYLKENILESDIVSRIQEYANQLPSVSENEILSFFESNNK